MAENIRDPAVLPRRPEVEGPVLSGPILSSRFRMDDRYRIYRRPGRYHRSLLFFTLSGQGYFRGDEGRAVLSRRGDFFLYEPKAEHDYGTVPGKNWDFHWAGFLPRASWAPWLRGVPAAGPAGLRAARLSSPALMRRIAAAFDEVHRDVKLGGTWRRELALNEIERVLILAAENIGARSRKAIDPRVQSSLEYLAGHLSEPVRVADLARRTFLSPSRFAHLFRQETGRSVLDFVLRTRMDEAAKLLEQTPSRVSEIAYALGFASPFHFSDRFRRHHGLSPRAYRLRRQGD